MSRMGSAGLSLGLAAVAVIGIVLYYSTRPPQPAPAPERPAERLPVGPASSTPEPPAADAPRPLAATVDSLSICSFNIQFLGNPNYTIRMYFAEPNDHQVGQRVFDVSVGEKKLLSNFDVAKEVAGHNRMVVKEFKGVIGLTAPFPAPICDWWKSLGDHMWRHRRGTWLRGSERSTAIFPMSLDANAS